MIVTRTTWPNGAVVDTEIGADGMARETVTLADGKPGLGATVWAMEPRPMTATERCLVGSYERNRPTAM